MPAAAVIHEEQALSILTECIKYVGCYNYYFKNVKKLNIIVILYTIIINKDRRLIEQRLNVVTLYSLP